jgi:probable HAF family extracellular repeat protein
VWHAFAWFPGEGLVDLGSLGAANASVAAAVNEHGLVVGDSRTAAGAIHAFAWEDGVMTDLNERVTSGTTESLRIAGDINDWGQISGQTVNGAGERSAFVAYPTPLP